jgi:hypothetical protein
MLLSRFESVQQSRFIDECIAYYYIYVQLAIVMYSILTWLQLNKGHALCITHPGYRHHISNATLYSD